jgi:fibro-slime domain-containing protein
MSLSIGLQRASYLPFSRRTLFAISLAILIAGCAHKGGGGDAGVGDGAIAPMDFATAQDLLPGVDLGTCGNGIIDPGETCDDGNNKPGDGCSSTCQTEIGWQCPVVGMACAREVYCGDGIVEPPETCDDGNTTPGDGCSGTCQLEPNYTCSTPTPPPTPPHETCTSTIVCGNGTVDPGEECDTGTHNGTAGSGCDATCQIVVGYVCSGAPSVCTLNMNTPVCGDGRVEAGEQCDAGSALNGVAGSGCTATCQLVAGYVCPTPGQACVRICGNGVINANLGEQCDAGAQNGVAGSGCSSTCQIVTDYSCTGAPSVCTLTVVCGNGRVDAGEQCDEGSTDSVSLMSCTTPGTGTCVSNNNGSNGCSSTCQLVSGWSCPYPNAPCVAAKCGDGVKAGNEQCDAGAANGTANQGCSSTCTILPGYVCTIDGNGVTSVCNTATVCGDGKTQGSEGCDDGNLIPYDGCSPTCTVEPGWSCVNSATADSVCMRSGGTHTCGNSLVEPTETCDDGALNGTPGDGCAANCQFATGYTCTLQTQAAPSTLTIPILYRDMIHECNGTAGTACTCVDETVTPHVSHGACNGGGGTTCTGTLAAYTPVITATCSKVGPPAGTTPNPDFDNTAVTNTGDAEGDLLTAATSSKPVFSTTPAVPARFVGDTTLTPNLTAGEVFCWWYNDKGCNGATSTNPYAQIVYMTGVWNTTTNKYGGVPTTLTLTTPDPVPSASSVYTFASPPNIKTTTTGTTAACTQAGLCAASGHTYVADGTCGCTGSGATTSCTGNCANYDATGFFPIDGLGWNDPNLHPGDAQQDTGDDGITTHNFSFTSEMHYTFTYNSATTASFNFTGDDDVWFFINGRLVVDLGGIHSAETKVYTLNSSSVDVGGAALGLTNGSWYSLDVFQAERHITGSDYTLSLQGFVHQTSVCSPICGDGVVEAGEACDLGSANAGVFGPPDTIAYNGCSANCKNRGPYCGDGTKNGTEQCDNGPANYTSPAYGTGYCTPACTTTPYCGDGIVQTQYGEQCDPNDPATKANCNSSCTLTNLCGDGIIEAGEVCDDGANNGATGDPCSSTCELRCGDGTVETGESCDLGSTDTTTMMSCTTPGKGTCVSNNKGGYGGCNANCTLAPYCGDGIKNGTEACDFGTANNTGAYGGCTNMCTLAPYCGDGIKNGTEQCDCGNSASDMNPACTVLNNQNNYGPGECTNTCQTAPYCGDGIVESSFGEQCDGGNQCNAMCKMSIQ